MAVVAGGTDDRIDVSSLSAATSLSAVFAMTAMVGSNAMIMFSAGNTLTLTNVLLGEAGNDPILGGTGSDYLYGGTGNNVMDGGAGIDILVSEGANDTINCGADQNYYYRQETANHRSRVGMVWIFWLVARSLRMLFSTALARPSTETCFRMPGLEPS